MVIDGFACGPLAANCWVVAIEAGGPCVVIDPGMAVIEPLHRMLAEHRLTPAAILLTHGHFDHSQGAADVAREYGVPVHVHPADRSQLRDPWTPVGLPVGTPIAGETRFIEPDDVRELGARPLPVAGLVLQVIEVPGHTPGSVAFGLRGHLFTGDFLFAGTVGRMDLPGGDEQAMRASLRREILPRPDSVELHPGHGASSTIGAERAGNPYLLSLR